MIEHLVFLKIRDEAGAVETIANALVSLKGRVPAIKDISCGRNVSDRSKGFNLGLRVLLETEADIEAYRVHPEHMKILNEMIKPVMEDMIVIDYTR